jgi:glycine hydroxymethyltransferase
MQDFGEQYATEVIRNAKRLANTLHGEGLSVLHSEKGYTECHQIIASIGDKEQAMKTFEALESAGIFTNAVKVPFTEGKVFGLRFGTAEVTRRGLSVDSIDNIAKMVAAIARKPSDSALIHEVKADIERLSALHPHIYYHHKNPYPDHLRQLRPVPRTHQPMPNGANIMHSGSFMGMRQFGG